MILHDNEPHYSQRDITPLLEAIWYIARLERLDTEAVSALNARTAARDALQKWNDVREIAYKMQTTETVPQSR
jgi:hypothetical protein